MSPLFHPIEKKKKRSLDLNRLLIQNPSSTYFIRIEGREFEEYGISDGDILVVDRFRTNQDHEWYVVVQDSEITLLPRTLHPCADCTYWGAVTHLIRKT